MTESPLLKRLLWSGLLAGTGAIANERPEVAAGAAFAGGFLLALILKRIAR